MERNYMNKFKRLRTEGEKSLSSWTSNPGSVNRKSKNSKISAPFFLDFSHFFPTCFLHCCSDMKCVRGALSAHQLINPNNRLFVLLSFYEISTMVWSSQTAAPHRDVRCLQGNHTQQNSVRHGRRSLASHAPVVWLLPHSDAIGFWPVNQEGEASSEKPDKNLNRTSGNGGNLMTTLSFQTTTGFRWHHQPVVA